MTKKFIQRKKMPMDFTKWVWLQVDVDLRECAEAKVLINVIGKAFEDVHRYAPRCIGGGDCAGSLYFGTACSFIEGPRFARFCGLLNLNVAPLRDKYFALKDAHAQQAA